ncbi:MAG: hypothetical protein QM756_19765 [Polyangiaceae bacterium]
MSMVAEDKLNVPQDSFESGAHPIAKDGVMLFVEMKEAFSQLDHEPLKEVLLDSLDAERESILAVAHGFSSFLRGAQPLEGRRRFFSSWQKTNNSAMSVEGLANRMTAEGEEKVNQGRNDDALQLFRAAGRLNRVADEDLGVGGQTLHFELYYRMATEFAGRDDAWQSRQYCLQQAADFKTWLDSTRLRSPVIVGLYSLLVHEGYTHAELEMIAQPFQSWAVQSMGLGEREARRFLAWISVHNGGTEKAHFAHSCASLSHYLAGSGAKVDLKAAEDIFRTYFRMKGAVMAALSELCA